MKYKYVVEGLDCPNCAKKLSDMIAKCEGIDAVKLNFLSEELTVESTLAEEAVFAIVTEQGKAYSKKVSVSRK